MTEASVKSQQLTKTDDDGNLVISDNPENEVTDLVGKIHEQLKASDEVKALAREIDLRDQNSLLAYGGKPAEEISTLADKILATVTKSSVQDSGVMLKELARLMKSFDPSDFEKEPTGFVGKLFGSAKKAIEKILAKYQTIGGEIDKINREISKYKGEMVQSNQTLEDLFVHNLSYYEALEKYVVGGNLSLDALKETELPKLEAKAAEGSQMHVVKLETMRTNIELLEQRVYDLEMAKMIALQTAPQIRMIQKGNFKLIAKIQSAFIVTIPLFKMGLVQAIALKRQKLVADSMKALDDATNELLLRNAQMTANQSKQIAKMGTSSVKMETVTEAWKTILQGIDDTKAIEDENRKAREEGTTKLHALQGEIMNKFKN